ncbi:MAG: copper chaperone PCu(A)C [Proteobacteria bacterium]|nr:copper chaperone PCu(A)C [Pseudomonadota bacterium]
MAQVERLEIPPKTIVVFHPGGYHLMLHESKRRLKAGDKVDFTLHFSSGQEVTVNAVIKRDPGSMDNHQHH